MARTIFQVALATSVITVGWGLPSFRQRAGQHAIKAQVATKGEFPWQAQLKSRGVHVCGAIVVSDRWLLTAAHCLSQLDDIDGYEVVLGEHDVGAEEGTEQRRRLADVVLYSGHFSASRSPRGSRQSDIALIRIDQPAVFDDFVQPITLPEPKEDFTGQDCVASGWGASGATADGPIYPRLLQKVPLRVLDAQQCLEQLAFFSFARRTMLCAVPPGRSRLCWGDSGGALVHYGARPTPVLAAVTSWGVDCGLSRTPSVFVDVPHHVNWIKDVIGQSLFDSD